MKNHTKLVLVLFLFFFGAKHKDIVGGLISVSAALALGFCVFSFVFVFARGFRFYFHSGLMALLLLTLYLSFYSLGLYVFLSDTYQYISSPITSILHLLLYSLFSIFLADCICRNQKSIGDVISAVVVLHVVYAISRYLMIVLGVAEATAAEIYKGREHFVLVGLFNEPAHFAIFQTLSLAFLIHFRGLKLNSWFSFFVSVSVFLTFSLSGLLLLLLTFMTGFFSGRKTLIRIFIFFVAVVFITASFAFIENEFTTRMLRVLSQKDTSAVVRLIGSWAGIVSFTDFWQYAFGIGLGNYSDFVLLNADPYFKDVLDREGRTWNIVAYVASVGGVVGLFLLVLGIWRMLRVNGHYCFIFFASLFAYGELAGPSFWLFYVLGVSGLVIQGHIGNNKLRAADLELVYPYKNR